MNPTAVERGHTIADVYRTLTGIQAAREARGDTSVMHLSHLFLGPADGTELRSTIVIRSIGESAGGLARSLDSVMAGDVSIGTPINAPAENCQDATLTRSYIVTNGVTTTVRQGQFVCRPANWPSRFDAGQRPGAPRVVRCAESLIVKIQMVEHR